MRYLKTISLARNNFYKAAKKFAFRSDYLTDINVEESQLHLTKIFQGLFQYTPNLKTLSIGKCHVQPHVKLFQNLPNVTSLTMPSTIETLSHDTFENTTRVQQLIMNYVPIDELQAAVFRNLSDLYSLHLKGIGINSVNYTSLPKWMWDNLTQIDLSYNPFICDCDIVWFRDWLQRVNKSEVSIVGRHDKDAYTCAFPPKYKGRNMFTLYRPSAIGCFTTDPDGYLIFAILVSVLSALVSAIVSVVHRFSLEYSLLEIRVQG